MRVKYAVRGTGDLVLGEGSHTSEGGVLETNRGSAL